MKAGKKTIYLSILLLALIGATWMVSKRSSDSSSQYDLSDRQFALEEIERVQSISLRYKSGTQFILSKTEEDWIINDQYVAHPNIIRNLLEVIEGAELKYIPPNAAYENIMSTIKRIGIEVRIFDNKGKIIRSYTVGGTTAGELGTIFLMEGSSQPYVMELPYFEGSLRGRFLFEQIDQLRNREVFNFKEDQIQKVAIEYPKDRSNSFVLERKDNNYTLQPFYKNGVRLEGKIKDGSIERFLRGFNKLDAEAYENQHIIRDSIRALVPMAVITVEDMETSKSVSLFPLIDVFNPGINTRVAGTDQRVERYFADCSCGDFFLVQDLLFRRILWKYEEFYE